MKTVFFNKNGDNFWQIWCVGFALIVVGLIML